MNDVTRCQMCGSDDPGFKATPCCWISTPTAFHDTPASEPTPSEPVMQVFAKDGTYEEYVLLSEAERMRDDALDVAEHMARYAVREETERCAKFIKAGANKGLRPYQIAHDLERDAIRATKGEG